jgi:hypothetical protein
MLTDLDGDELPYLEGEGDVPEDGEVAIPDDVVAEIVIETGHDIAGAIAAIVRVTSREWYGSSQRLRGTRGVL